MGSVSSASEGRGAWTHSGRDPIPWGDVASAEPCVYPFPCVCCVIDYTLNKYLLILWPMSLFSMGVVFEPPPCAGTLSPSLAKYAPFLYIS